MDIISNLRKSYTKNSIFHKGFEIGILLKGINGVFEIIGGILLTFLNPSRLRSLVSWLTKGELLEDPRDAVANFLIKFSSSFTISAQHFGTFYLISHGLIKLILVILLWKRKPWAYPLTIISLTLFIIYQIYRYILHPSNVLIILTIFDVIMIVLTFIEYKNIKSNSYAN